MNKSPLIFGVALLAGWVLLATGALTSLAGVAPVANPPHVAVTETIDVVVPLNAELADASVPNANVQAPAAKPLAAKATL